MEADTTTPTHEAEAAPAFTPAEARRALAAQASPLDRAIMKPLGNAPQAMAPSLFDAHAPLTQVPLSMRAENVTSLDGYEELEGYGCTLAVNAMTALTDTAQKIIDAREVLRTNQIKHEAERVLDVHDMHAKLSPAVSRQVDAAAATLRAAVASHESKLSEAVKDNSAGAEIRSYVRSLTPAERLPVLMNAINSGDATVVGALLGSPSPMLTGIEMTAEMRAAALRQWHSRQRPKEARQLALMQAALGKLEAAGSAFIGATDGLIGAKDSTVRRARASREKYRTVIGVSL